MTGLSRDQLAWAAERRVWRILLDTGEEFSGLPPSTVDAFARRRVAHLDDLLGALTQADQDDALERDVTETQRDAAFAAAAREMQGTLSMVARAGGDA